MAMLSLILTAAAAGGALALHHMPGICAWEPSITVDAGASVSARITNPWGKSCEAVLRFNDPAYLPITWSFAAISCMGEEIAEFTIPSGAPNGDAVITWQCAGQASQTCSHVFIQNGLGNLDSVNTLLVGRVGCVSISRQTTTTLITRTSLRTTVVQTLSSGIDVPTTSFSSQYPSVSTGSTSSSSQYPSLSTGSTSSSSQNPPPSDTPTSSSTQNPPPSDSAAAPTSNPPGSSTSLSDRPGNPPDNAITLLDSATTTTSDHPWLSADASPSGSATGTTTSSSGAGTTQSTAPPLTTTTNMVVTVTVTECPPPVTNT